jgi:hypothetical protein
LAQDELLVELNATKYFEHSHAAHCMKTLGKTSLTLSLLLNFSGPRLWIRRSISNPEIGV